MSVEENKATLRRNFDEIWNKKNFSLIPDLVSPDYVGINFAGEFKGQDGYENMIKAQLANVPDMNVTIDEMVGEGDNLMAVVTTTGTYSGQMGNSDASPKQFKYTYVLVNKYVDGKVQKATAYGNTLDLLRQLGATIPSEWGMG
jgi:predicted ester cyclase